jgi:hypothetical protein
VRLKRTLTDRVEWASIKVQHESSNALYVSLCAPGAVCFVNSYKYSGVAAVGAYKPILKFTKLACAARGLLLVPELAVRIVVEGLKAEKVRALIKRSEKALRLPKVRLTRSTIPFFGFRGGHITSRNY